MNGNGKEDGSPTSRRVPAEGLRPRIRPAGLFRRLVLVALAAAAPGMAGGCGTALYGVPEEDIPDMAESAGEDAATEDGGAEDVAAEDVATPEDVAAEDAVPEGTWDYGVPDGSPEATNDYGVPDGAPEAINAYGVPDGS